MSRPERVRVLLVDDNPLFLAGLAALLREHESILLVGAANNGQEAIAEAERLRPDVVVMDVNMPVQGGVSATQAIVSRLPGTKVILVTGLASDDWVYDPGQVGAYACVSKSTPVDRIIKTIASAAASAPASSAQPGLGVSRHGHLGLPRERLTAREIEILRLLGKGQRTSHIARQLRLQQKTIQNYITVIYEKLGVHDRSQAVLHAARNGLLDDLA